MSNDDFFTEISQYGLHKGIYTATDFLIANPSSVYGFTRFIFEKNQYLDYIEIEWGDGTTSTYTYSDTYLRFSGFISRSLWERLDTELSIEVYGILFAETDYLQGEALSSKNPDGQNVKRYYTALTETKRHPTLANDRQKGDLTGDYYIWNLKKDVTQNLTKSYTAVAFIVAGGETLFLDEISYSAKTLADEYIKTGFYPEDHDEGALYNLAHSKVGD